MSFVAVATMDELREDVPVGVAWGDERLALVRHAGAVWAIRDECSHANVPLSEGDVEGCAIECYLHGSRFDLRTGAPLGPPAVEPVPVFATRVEGEQVLVDLPQTAEAAEPAETGGRAGVASAGLEDLDNQNQER